MQLVFILGDSAVGKMTVGQELAKQTGLRLFHNHIMVEPVIEVFGKYSSFITDRLRWVIFEEFAESDLDGMIFTMMFDFKGLNEKYYVRDIIETFKASNPDLEVYFVELRAPLETRLERNHTENRLKHKASKRNLEESDARVIKDSQTGRFYSYDGEEKTVFGDCKYIKIDNKDMTVEEQVERIVNEFDMKTLR
jgi:hypothetical protein